MVRECALYGAGCRPDQGKSEGHDACSPAPVRRNVSLLSRAVRASRSTFEVSDGVSVCSVSMVACQLIVPSLLSSKPWRFIASTKVLWVGLALHIAVPLLLPIGLGFDGEHCEIVDQPLCDEVEVCFAQCERLCREIAEGTI